MTEKKFRRDSHDSRDGRDNARRGASRNGAAEYGPLGPGKAPVKDPMRGLAGMMSGTLIMQAISIFLGLTVILKIDGGVCWARCMWWRYFSCASPGQSR